MRFPTPFTWCLREAAGWRPAGRLLTFAFVLGLAGCGSPATPARHGEAGPPQSPLVGDAVFFDGMIVVHAEVLPFGHVRRPLRAEEDSASSDLRTRGAGRAGGRRGGGRGEPADSTVEVPGPGETMVGHRPPTVARLGAPRQTLGIRFTNRGTAPIAIVVTELRSLIGNFAPQPERFTLAPGATAPLEPVSGDAGGNLEWLDVTVSLRHERTAATAAIRLQRMSPE